MPETLVKICGLTDAAEAAACASLGAWAIGVVFAPESPRRVDVARARRVLADLPAGVRRVGVFVDPEPDAVAEAVRVAELTDVQLHGVGDLAPVRAAVDVPIFQGLAVDGPQAVARARASAADLVLLDASVPGRHGGTGRTFDWDLLREHPPARPFILAGGLDPANVADAIARTRPTGVDVSSGVEAAPGRKDLDRVAAFIAAARQTVEVG